MIDEALDNIFQPIYGRDNGKMKTDVQTSDSGYVFDIDMPGFKKEEIDLTLDKGYLTVSANKNEEESDENKNYLFKERRTTSCSRTFYVGEVNEDGMKASLNNGILNIVVPKKEKIETSKKIAIE